MTTPVNERPEPTYTQPSYNMSDPQAAQGRTSLDGPPTLPAYNVNVRQRGNSRGAESTTDGTMVGEGEEYQPQRSQFEEYQPQRSQFEEYQPQRSQFKENTAPARPRAGSLLTVRTEYEPGDPLRGMVSPSQTREQAHRLDDDLALLKIERQISRIDEELSRTKSNGGDTSRSKSRMRTDHVDEFDEATNPVHERTAVYKPAESPATGFAKFVKHIHHSNWLVRYFTYIVPVVLVLLIPLMLGAYVFDDALVGGVELMWFMIWLQIVWLTLWCGRILAKCLPVPIGLIASLFTNNSKKWRDMGKQLELPGTIFFWWLAIEISFLPTMIHHQRGQPSGTVRPWMNTMNKVLVSFFVGAVLNFLEKILIQFIAISFHLRTYADRIDINKFQIGSLTKLYTFSKRTIEMDDSYFEQKDENGSGSGARTPGQALADAAEKGKKALGKFGDVAGKVAGDFTGKTVVQSTHPTQVVLALLHTTSGAQVLARRLYRTFAREETATVISDDLRAAFENDEEADAAFTMFDKDMNGDISMEELEAVCVEIGRERKSITASLKDLDSVVSKLDDVFMFIVVVIVILVFVSLISTSAAGVLTSAGSAVLALSWLFSATAQEFLQSVIFVFVKHPFDVGDRVGIYGNTGALMRGDDYFVKEISLLYTEFKKMEGHIVQAPNSYLNTLFILNQRRSGGLAEAVSITIKFGTTLEQIESLRNRLLEFVQSEKREYQNNILTELREIVEVHSLKLNVVFFYKSNWQNEGLRLARRNKFFCAMMVIIQELGIEGPNMRMPGMRESFPMYLANVPHTAAPGAGHNGNPDNPHGIHENRRHEEESMDPPFVSPIPGQESSTGSQAPHTRINRGGSILRTCTRGESISQMTKRVDFSLGMQNAASSDMSGDVYEDRDPNRAQMDIIQASRERERSRASQERVRESNELQIARTTSRDQQEFSPAGIVRRSTPASVHRNRFFGRKKAPGDETTMENGMADIAEESTPHSRIDPRTGMVSPAAWRMTSDQSNIAPQNAAAAVPPQLPRQVSGSGALGDVSSHANVQHPPGHRPIGRAQTDAAYEMRSMR